MIDLKTKTKERVEMRSKILDAAKLVFIDKGYYQTSMRNIAETAGCSAGTIYLYFKDKDELFHALHEEGFKRLLQQLQPLAFVDHPFERLVAMGKVYLHFAKENKDYYDLMFTLPGPIKHELNSDKWEMGNRTLSFLKQMINECKQKGFFDQFDTDALSFTIWSAVHGMAALYCRDRCKAYPELSGDDLLNQGFEVLKLMLQNLSK